MRPLSFLMLTLLGLTLIIAWVIPAQAGWVNVQSAHQGVNTDSDWVNVQTFQGVMDQDPNWIDAQHADQGIEAQEMDISGVNWWMIIIWLLIIWIPAFMLGLLAPGYGTIAGLLIMGALVVVLHPSFMMVFFYMILNGAILFWRGPS